MIQQVPSISIDTYSKWIKVTKSYIDFSAVSLTNDIEIYSLPAGWVLESNIVKPITSFSGGIISAYTISVGINGNLIKYSAAINVLAAPSDTNQTITQNFDVQNWGSATSIRAASVSVTGLLNTATQGSVEFYLLISKAKQ